MKKIRIYLWALALAAASLSTAGCGTVPQTSTANSDVQTTTVSDDESSGETETSAESGTSGEEPETTVSESDSSESETESEISESAAETSSVSESDTSVENNEADLTETAKELMYALNEIDRFGGGAFEYDETAIVDGTDGYTQFARVNDDRFKTVSELKNYMNSYLTTDMIEEKYSNIVGGDNPHFKDIDGVLYGNISGARGCGYAWTGNVEIKNASDTAFTAIAEYDDYGAVSDLTINIVLDGGTWKISSVEI